MDRLELIIQAEQLAGKVLSQDIKAFVFADGSGGIEVWGTNELLGIINVIREQNNLPPMKTNPYDGTELCFWETVDQIERRLTEFMNSLRALPRQ